MLAAMAGGDDLDWDDLRYFLAGIRAGTLAGAARGLGIEHTTVGRRLAALERALGATLTLRGPEGLRLTSLGERVLPLVEEIERNVHALRDTVRSNAARVRLAVPSGFAQLFVAELGRLRSAHPDLVLELVSGARVADLEHAEADLAVRSAPVDNVESISRPLCVTGWSLYASAAYLARRSPPSDLDDLGGHELCGFHPSLAQTPAAAWVEARAGTARIVLRSREMTDMLAAALGGIGLALLPCLLADTEPGLSRLTPEVLVRRPLSLVYRREMRLSEPVRGVIDFVFEVMREHAARIEGVLTGADALGGPGSPGSIATDR
jgi:DNA-binding transcriptional LysR family regulator